MTRDEWISAAAAIAIGVIETSSISIEKLRIDWDWFQTGGLFLICAAAGLFGYWQPQHAWRWGLLAIVAIPPMIVALIGAWLRRRRTSQ